MSKFNGTKTLGILGLVCFLSACGSTNSKTQKISAIKAQQEISTNIKLESDFLKDFQLIQLPGDNFLSAVHKSGSRMLFFSSGRISHSKFQVYEYDFGDQKERRITHQNGHAFHASYHPNNQHVIYASTTDFEKEDLSKLFQIAEVNEDKSWSNLVPQLKSDLFISRLNGTNIIRATYMDSGEQYPIYHPKDYSIIYKLTRDNTSSIESMTRYRKPIGPLSSREGKFSMVDISKSGKKLAWIQFDEDKGFFLETMDWKSKKKENKELKEVLGISSLNWISDSELLMTAQTDDDNVHQLYYLKADLSCMVKMAQSEYGIQNAMLAGKSKLVMTAYTGTHWQLVESSLKELPNCNPPKG